MRSLIYVPIVHTEADLGSFRGALKREFLRTHQPADWQQHTEAIREFWRGLRRRIEGLQIEYPRTYVYQDGLPVCGKEVQIINDLARQGSQNHQLVLWLVHSGATVVGTESPELLLEEYKLVREVLSALDGHERPSVDYGERAADLLAKRDEYIRRRIEATLPDETVGLLFVGLTHRVDEGLASDIHVSYLIHNLPFSRNGDVKPL